MAIIDTLLNLNYIAVASATVASYVLGFTWYHWAVFGEVWAKSLGLTKETADNTEGLGGAFLISLISGLLKALFLAVLMSLISVSGIFYGVMFGALTALVFTATSLGYYNGFARMPSSLTLINASHSVVELALIGAIIGAF